MNNTKHYDIIYGHRDPSIMF